MSQAWYFKPPVIIGVVVLLALIGLSSGLRHQAEKPERAAEVESGEFDRMETGGTRIVSVDAPSTKLSASGQQTGERAPARKQGPRKQIVEDFDMAKKRAEGDMVITGRIFGREDRGEQPDWRSRGGWGQDRSTSSSDRGRRDGGQQGDNGNRQANSSSNRSNFGWLGNDATSETRGQRSSRTFTQTASASTSETKRPQFDWTSRLGKPLENAEVLLFENDPNTTHPALRTVTTDKEGSFTIANINGNNQRYIIVAKADGFSPEAASVTVNREPEQTFIRLDKGVPFNGKVVDAETRQPVQGAVIYQPNSRMDAVACLGVTTTSLNGSFSFPNTQAGENMTMVHANGYATKRVRINAPDNNAIIELEPGGASVEGITIDRLTGKPQGGAKVWVTGKHDLAESVVSAADGTFKIDNLPEGEVSVYAVRGMKSEEQHFDIKKAEQVKDVQILLPSELLVSGQVINIKDRKPMQGVKVWFQSNKGAQFKKTNSDGRFAFETMAIDEYALLVHEKGLLPMQDKHSTEAKETIVRKVAKNQSSDEVTIRLKPVPTVEGTVTGPSRRGGDSPINDADITLAFADGRDFYQLKTKSDPAGNFFINLPNGERGKGVLVAKKDYSLDTKDVRVPRNKPVELKLTRDMMFGQVLLSDETPLDGINVKVTRTLSETRAESNSADRITLNDLYTMRGGMLMGALPRNSNVELNFSLPDGVNVSKPFQTNKLLNSRPIFVYDPVTQDIVADTTPRQRNNNWSRWGDRGRGFGNNGNGNGNGGGGNNGGGNGSGRRPGGNGGGNGQQQQNNNGGAAAAGAN